MKLNQCKQHKNHSLTATKGSGFFYVYCDNGRVG